MSSPRSTEIGIVAVETSPFVAPSETFCVAGYCDQVEAFAPEPGGPAGPTGPVAPVEPVGPACAAKFVVT